MVPMIPSSSARLGHDPELERAQDEIQPVARGLCHPPWGSLQVEGLSAGSPPSKDSGTPGRHGLHVSPRSTFGGSGEGETGAIERFDCFGESPTSPRTTNARPYPASGRSSSVPWVAGARSDSGPAT